MIYKFKSKACGDLIMLGPNGDQMLRLIGHEPAPKGIIEVEQMAAAIEALQTAVHEHEAEAAAQAQEADEPGGRPAITLRQRLWPVIDMLKRSLAEREPVVWGV
jgi:riboflavin synthase